MKVGITFDLVPTVKGEGPDDRYEEFDKPETIEAIADVIRGEGHEILLLGDGRPFLEKVLADPPDFVFNIAEGEGSGRCREARVPAVLEMLGIPYSGSDPLTLAASLDKAVAKALVSSQEDTRPGIKTPRGWTLPDSVEIGEDCLRGIHGDTFGGGYQKDRTGPARVILKPMSEGSSKGIRGGCLASNLEEAAAIYRDLVEIYHQPILMEEFIEGDEVTVGLCGNFDGKSAEQSIEILGTMRIVPRDKSEPFVYSLDVKRDWKNRVDYEAPASLSGSLVWSVPDIARSIFAILNCRDLARIDFRVRDGVPYFIEANPLPGLAPGVSDLVILAEGHGIGYADLIRKIFYASLTRVGLQ